MQRKRLIRVVSTVGVLAATAGAPARAVAARPEPVSGNFYGYGCVPTGTNFYDPVSSRFDCSNTSTYTGTWTGESLVHAWGTSDLVTGDTKGTIEERVFATTADGHEGELHFIEAFTIDGATYAEKITATLLDGSGDFAGATGRIYLSGTALSAGPSYGTYSGSWTHPAFGPNSGSAASSAPGTHPVPTHAGAPRARAHNRRHAHRARHRHGRRGHRVRR